MTQLQFMKIMKEEILLIFIYPSIIKWDPIEMVFLLKMSSNLDP